MLPPLCSWSLREQALLDTGSLRSPWRLAGALLRSEAL